ncbi:MAG: serine O-acetyltransferase [Dehalococcoidia bacterium]|nr:serine O-acetyltransferase [Dehalococcoidia bacterium]
MGWFTRIREDVAAARLRDPAAHSTAEILLTYPGIHALIIHRAAHRLSNAGWGVPARLLSHFGRYVTGIEIHPGATIGHGLFIDHGMGVVIGETAEIGDNCHIFQGVTLGGTSTRREKRHPTLRNGVVVGAGAKIIGAVTIGENARIGAGAVVVSSVPPNATVVGVPGHVVAFTDQSNDTVERLPDPGWDRLGELEQRLARLEERLGGAPTNGATPTTSEASTSEPAREVAP